MKKTFALTLICLLTACAQAPEAYKAGPFSFEKTHAPITLTVQQVQVRNHYQSSGKRPNLEQEFPVPPAAVVDTWVKQRLRTTPGSGTNSVLEVTIHEASVVEQALPKTQGFKGLITDDQEARYTAKLSVSFKHFNNGSSTANATGDVVVSRARSIHERATVNEREAIYHQMTDALMTDFDREANARLRQYFSPYIR